MTDFEGTRREGRGRNPFLVRAKAERGTDDEGEGLIIFLKAKKREGEKLAAIMGCLMSNKTSCIY